MWSPDSFLIPYPLDQQIDSSVSNFQPPFKCFGCFSQFFTFAKLKWVRHSEDYEKTERMSHIPKSSLVRLRLIYKVHHQTTKIASSPPPPPALVASSTLLCVL